MIKARALRMSIVLVGPPGYVWKQGPKRDAVEDLDLQVMRMRCCRVGRSSKLPSGSYLQVATTYARIPINAWRCTCQAAGEPAQLTEHDLDWHGQGAQKAEWRDNTLAIMTARLIGQIDLHTIKKPRECCTS
eukprot:5568283-Pyramimonas_sp.AAC.1